MTDAERRARIAESDYCRKLREVIPVAAAVQMIDDDIAMYREARRRMLVRLRVQLKDLSPALLKKLLTMVSEAFDAGIQHRRAYRKTLTDGTATVMRSTKKSRSSRQ